MPDLPHDQHRDHSQVQEEDWIELIDVAGLICYVLGSLIWTAVAIWGLCLDHDDIEPSVLACVASSSFMVYGSILLYRWYLCRFDPPTWYKGGIPSSKMYHFDWDLPIVVTFWLGTLGDLSTSLFEMGWYMSPYPSAVSWVAGGSDIFASHFWFISGFLELIKWRLDRSARRWHGAPTSFTLRPFPKLAHSYYDWSGAGSLFFFPGSLGYAIGAYLCIFSSYDPCWTFQFIGALGFLMDSILQSIAYLRPIPEIDRQTSTDPNFTYTPLPDVFDDDASLVYSKTL